MIKRKRKFGFTSVFVAVIIMTLAAVMSATASASLLA
jgi:hypothetical protein